MIQIGQTTVKTVIFNGTSVNKVYAVLNGVKTLVFSKVLAPLLKNVTSNNLSNATLSNASGSVNAYKGFNGEGLIFGYSPATQYLNCNFTKAQRVEEIRVNISNRTTGTLTLTVYDGSNWSTIGSVSANGNKTWEIHATIKQFRLSCIQTEATVKNLNAYHYE